MKKRKIEKEANTLTKRLFRILTYAFLTICIVILIALSGLFLYNPTPSAGVAFSEAGKTIQLSDGRTLGYTDTGDPDGRPVFFFHGGPGSRLGGLIFNELNKKLGIRLISPDRPGYGLSDFQSNRTYLDWADDVSELADKLGINRFGVLGWSSGGPHAAAVAYKIPRRLSVVAIVAGEGSYADINFPLDKLPENTFAGSSINKLFIWGAENATWIIEAFFRAMRIPVFSDPVALFENANDPNMSKKDNQYFARREFSMEMLEAFRKGVDGATHEFTMERLKWPFNLKEIQSPTVLVFHGEQDGGVPPIIGKYVCKSIPSCDEPVIFSNEGHSVIFYRYREIIHKMLKAWK